MLGAGRALATALAGPDEHAPAEVNAMRVAKEIAEAKLRLATQALQRKDAEIQELKAAYAQQHKTHGTVLASINQVIITLTAQLQQESRKPWWKRLQKWLP